MLVTLEGIPHPLICCCLICYEAKTGMKINSVYSFDTDTKFALKLNGTTVPVGDFEWEVLTNEDKEKLQLVLDPRWHDRIKVTSNGVQFRNL